MPTSYKWRMVVAGDDGAMRETTELAAGSSGLDTVPLGPMIPLPPGAMLALLPGCRAEGMPVSSSARSQSRDRSAGRALPRADRDGAAVPTGDCVATEGSATSVWTGSATSSPPRPRTGEGVGGEGRPVGALLPTGYTRLLAPAYIKEPGAPHMPLFGYTAVASLHGKLFVSAVPLDPGGAWDPSTHNTSDLPSIVERRLASDPDNRLLAHHAHCAIDYGCYTAQNLFYGRDEMAIAVSVACNAACVGCISDQPDDIEAPHDRIAFTPTVEEIIALALPHLESAPRPIVSFGQGCEGEPLLRARLIGRAIERTRSVTDRGQFHINTNGSNVGAVQHLIDAGLDSIRVSMFSAIDRNHIAYYGPRRYGLADMEESLRIARHRGLHTSVNLLTYPGFNDTPAETDALIAFLRRAEVRVVQLRTLNMDRELLEERVGFPREPAMGIAAFMDRLRVEAGVELASHTPFVGRAVPDNHDSSRPGGLPSAKARLAIANRHYGGRRAESGEPVRSGFRRGESHARIP